MESMLKDNGSIVYKCLNEENKYELNAEIKLLSSSSAEKSECGFTEFNVW